MKVKELIKELKDLDENLDIYVSVEFCRFDGDIEHIKKVIGKGYECYNIVSGS